MSYDRSDARELARQALASQLAQVRDALRAPDELRRNETRLVRELAALEKPGEASGSARADRRATLPSGATAEIASPCSEDWDAMVGDDRVRHCSRCQKNVYDLSALTAEEAARILAERGERCIRFFRRKDGTLLTSDCPVGRPRKVALRVLTAVAVALGASAAGYTASRLAAPSRGRIEGNMLMGDMMPTS